MDREKPFLLEMKDISKAFPGVQALNRVCMSCFPGEIHGLIGENGAGKSTLIKILMGLYHSDSGKVFMEGSEIDIRNSAEARWKYRIDSVFQEPSLVPSLTVAENIFLGREKEFYVNGLISRRDLRQKTQEVLTGVCANSGISIPDPDEILRNLGPAEGKLVEIAKAIASAARVLILDEVTALFARDQIAALFRILRDLKDKGITILFITHRLGEIFEICDRATILKDGEWVDTVNVMDTSDHELIRMMTGKKTGMSFPPRKEIARQNVIMTLSGITKKGILNDVSLQLHQGEILALAGLRGRGQTELLRIIYGLMKPDHGEITIDGHPVHITKTKHAIRQGIIYLSNDRTEELMLTQTVQKNLALPTLAQRSILGFVQGRAERDACERVVSNFAIKIFSLHQETANLSGGNKQKVALGKWLPAKPRIFLLNEPTQGIDVGVKTEVYHLMRRLVEEGGSIIVVLTDMLEILGLPDRILVMGDQRIKAEFSATDATEENILRASLG